LEAKELLIEAIKELKLKCELWVRKIREYRKAPRNMET